MKASKIERRETSLPSGIFTISETPRSSSSYCLELQKELLAWEYTSFVNCSKSVPRTYRNFSKRDKKRCIPKGMHRR